MGEQVTFLEVKDPKRHALTKSGYKSLESDGRLIVYCTDTGPLDPRFHLEWVEWRKQKDVKP